MHFIASEQCAFLFTVPHTALACMYRQMMVILHTQPSRIFAAKPPLKHHFVTLLGFLVSLKHLLALSKLFYAI